jgi:hypothetical protein
MNGALQNEKDQRLSAAVIKAGMCNENDMKPG